MENGFSYWVERLHKITGKYVNIEVAFNQFTSGSGLEVGFRLYIADLSVNKNFETPEQLFRYCELLEVELSRTDQEVVGRAVKTAELLLQKEFKKEVLHA